MVVGGSPTVGRIWKWREGPACGDRRSEGRVVAGDLSVAKSWRHKVLGGKGIFEFPSFFTFQPTDKAVAPALF